MAAMAFFQTDNLWINQLADGVAALVLDVAQRKVNVLSARVLSELDQALDRVSAGNFQVLVVRSGKPDHFCAGADLQEIRADKDPAEFVAQSARGQQVFDKLARLSVPSVAVVAGACLGGGLELALACDYRVAVNDPHTQFGLPEMELGLLPAWGGTQRLPRVVGLERSLQMILGGRRLGPADALRWGLVDELTEGADDPPALLARPAKQRRQRLPLHTWRQWFLESTGFGRKLLFRGARRLLQRRVPDDMPAPWEAFEAVRAGLHSGIEAGMAYEREALGRLAQSPAFRHLTWLREQREQARKPAAAAAAAGEAREEPFPIRRVGIVGNSPRAVHLAHLTALRGFGVVFRAANEAALGLTTLQLVGLLNHSVEKGVMSPVDMQRRMANIHGTSAWKNFDQVDLVLVASGDDDGDLFVEMERHVGDKAVLAGTTSAFRLSDVQPHMKQPARLAGLHFIDPVSKMPLVEIARGSATAAHVSDDLRAWCRKMGKTAVVVPDSPGLIVHRVLFPYLNEAIVLLHEGLAHEQIDEAMIRFGMGAGPLEQLDQIGIDAVTRLGEALEEVLRDRGTVHPLLAAMEEHGWLGQKTKRGFYVYGGRRRRVNHEIAALLAGMPRESSPWPALSKADLRCRIQERLVRRLVDEARQVVLTGLADAATVDLALVLGAEFAPHRGGPLRYAEQVPSVS